MRALPPGWIDLQVNGFAGIDFNAPDLTPQEVVRATEALAQAGTAAYCPTLITGDVDTLCANMATILEAMRQDSEVATRILGFHLEGPFISSQPGAVGAHNPDWVRAPDIAVFDKLNAASNRQLRLLTVAAEVAGGDALVRHAVACGVTVSCGHQTAHTVAQLERMVAAGAKALTHLGNGVPNMLPRHDNIIWAGLAEERLTVMFIPDGHHLPRHLLKVYVRAAGVSRLVAVTDASHPAGLPPGRYQVLGNDAVLEPDGLLHNPEKGCLVGSSATMRQVMAVLDSLQIGLTNADLLEIGRNNPLRLLLLS